MTTSDAGVEFANAEDAYNLCILVVVEWARQLVRGERQCVTHQYSPDQNCLADDGLRWDISCAMTLARHATSESRSDSRSDANQSLCHDY